MGTPQESPELFDLRMSEDARPLLKRVTQFLEEVVAPMQEEFYALGENPQNRWEFAPGQLELLDAAKAKAKDAGLWNFFLPDSEVGGLTNLDYAYIAVELGKYPLGSECLNCSAPDTGNMEVLERVGTPEQKKQWLEPLLNGEIRSAYAMTEPDVASSDAKNVATVGGARRRRVRPQRREVLHLRRRRSALQDHDRHVQDQPGCGRRTSSSRRSWCRWTRPGVEIVGPMHVFGHDDAPHGHMHLRFTDVRVPGRPTCCSARAAASRSARSASAPAASTTACGPSARARRRSS